jgi:hypothetical protein
VLDNSIPTSNSRIGYKGRPRPATRETTSLRSFLSAIWPRNLSSKARAVAQQQATRAARALRAIGPAALALARQVLKGARRRLALTDRHVIVTRYWLQSRFARHGGVATGVAIFILIIASFFLAPVLRNVVEVYFNSERFPLLRGLLATTGGALVGATAIGFSVVMIAVQLNFARMPHGLFRRLSSDLRLLGTFAGTFLLAIGVSALSLVPDASWAALALIAATLGTLLILILFFYGYRRALDLINPAVQLRIIVGNAQGDLHQWARRAQRMAPLLNLPVEREEDEDLRAQHDLARLAFFRANPLWTGTARLAVAHAISFARRYAEQGDFEVSGHALQSVILINASYVAAKGKTFFVSNPIFDIPEASDGFINDTLEHLRRLARISTVRGDEEATRQILTTMP